MDPRDYDEEDFIYDAYRKTSDFSSDSENCDENIFIKEKKNSKTKDNIPVFDSNHFEEKKDIIFDKKDGKEMFIEISYLEEVSNPHAKLISPKTKEILDIPASIDVEPINDFDDDYKSENLKVNEEFNNSEQDLKEKLDFHTIKISENRLLNNKIHDENNFIFYNPENFVPKNDQITYYKLMNDLDSRGTSYIGSRDIDKKYELWNYYKDEKLKINENISNKNYGSVFKCDKELNYEKSSIKFKTVDFNKNIDAFEKKIIENYRKSIISTKCPVKKRELLRAIKTEYKKVFDDLINEDNEKDFTCYNQTKIDKSFDKSIFEKNTSLFYKPSEKILSKQNIFKTFCIVFLIVLKIIIFFNFDLFNNDSKTNNNYTCIEYNNNNNSNNINNIINNINVDDFTNIDHSGLISYLYNVFNNITSFFYKNNLFRTTLLYDNTVFATAKNLFSNIYFLGFFYLTIGLIALKFLLFIYQIFKYYYLNTNIRRRKWELFKKKYFGY